MKLIIAGSRNLENDDLVERWVLTKFDIKDIDEIVSGGARGADSCGESFARKYDIPIAIFPAEWNIHGRAAGPIRNAQMAKYGDVLIAFTSGGRGTTNMINTMKKQGKPVHVIDVRTAGRPMPRKASPNQSTIDRFVNGIEQRVKKASGVKSIKYYDMD